MVAVAGGALAVLTSFRFFAALAVFLHHTVHGANSTGSNLTGISQLFWEGWSGVAFFFVLSGFILTYTYYERMAERTREGTRRFWRLRAARVVPLHLLTFAVALAAAAPLLRAHLLGGSLSALSQITLTQAWIPAPDPLHHGQMLAFGYNGPAWSLSCEAFFYALFPVLIVMVVAVRRSWMLAAAALAMWAWSMLIALQLGSLHMNALVYLFPPFRLAEFVIGMCLGVLFVRHRHGVRGGARLWTALEIGALAALAVGVLCSSLAPAATRYAAYYLPFFVAMLAVFAFERGHVSSLLRHPWLVFLGEISFAFYLTSVLVLRAGEWLGLSRDIPAPAFDVAALIITLGVSAAVHQWFERPTRAALRGRPKPRAEASLPAAAPAPPALTAARELDDRRPVAIRRQVLELGAVDLAAGGARHLVEKHDLLGRLVAHPLAGKADQLLGGGPLDIVTYGDVGPHVLAVQHVVHTDHPGALDAGMLEQRPLHHLRGDVGSVVHDDLLAPAAEIEIAVLVGAHHVARIQPSVAKQLLGRRSRCASSPPSRQACESTAGPPDRRRAPRRRRRESPPPRRAPRCPPTRRGCHPTGDSQTRAPSR